MPPHDLPFQHPAVHRPPVVKRTPRPPVVPGHKPPAAAPRRPVPQTPSMAANAQVDAQINPVLASQDRFNQTQNNAIQSFAQALLGKLTPIAGQVGADYDKALGQQQAFTNAAAGSIAAANPSQQTRALLQAIGAPEAQQQQLADQNTQAFGGAAGTLQFLGGASAGGQLAADRASATSFANALPGINALKGQQDLLSALGTQRDARQKVLDQRPGMYQDALQNITSNAAENRKYNLSVREQMSKERQQKVESIIAMGYDPATGKLTPKAAADLERVQQGWDRIDAQNRAITATNDRANATEQGRNARSAAQIAAADARNAARIAAQNKRAAQADKEGKTGKAGKTGKNGVKPPTANQVNTLIEKWKHGTDSTTHVKAPKPDANGNPVYRTVNKHTDGLQFAQAYKRLRAMGVDDVKAREYLSTAYKRGEQGRAWLTNEEQHALKAANLPSQPHRYKSIAYLNKYQVAALKAAHLLPPGQWVKNAKTKTQNLMPVWVIEEGY